MNLEEVVHDFISWLQETKKIDMSTWKILDDYVDEYFNQHAS